MCYLNYILRRKFLYLSYILKIFYLYDLMKGKTLTVVSTADITNVSKFAFTFFLVSNFMVFKTLGLFCSSLTLICYFASKFCCYWFYYVV
jgi:hypothetical protein